VEAEERIPSVSEVVARAAVICDPDGHDPAVAGLVERFEDDDRPATAVPALADVVSAEVEDEGPAVIGAPAKMTAFVAAWLSTNFEFADDRERVLRESSRAAFDGQPPAELEAWLAEQGI
jgi:hypothetical protein